MSSTVSKSSFATMCGVSAPAISRQCRPGGRLFEAIVDGKIDTRHRAAVDYMERERAGSASEPPRERPPARRYEKRDEDDDDERKPRVDSRAELEIKKIQAQTYGINLKNAKEVGKVVSREMVVNGIYNPVETLCAQLLGDYCKASAALVESQVKAGANVIEIEAILRKQMSSFIRAAKTKMKACVDEMAK